MELKIKHIKALEFECPYCHAKPNESCKVTQGNTFSQGTEPRDQWGRPLLHTSRVKIVQLLQYLIGVEMELASRDNGLKLIRKHWWIFNWDTISGYSDYYKKYIIRHYLRIGEFILW